jgi:hypothetical protein
MAGSSQSLELISASHCFFQPIFNLDPYWRSAVEQFPTTMQTVNPIDVRPFAISTIGHYSSFRVSSDGVLGDSLTHEAQIPLRHEKRTQGPIN